MKSPDWARSSLGEFCKWSSGRLRAETTFRRRLRPVSWTCDSFNISNKFSIVSASLERLLEEQRTKNEWANFVQADELILKYGFINKRKKGLFTRRRMLLLTSKPRLIYIDPSSKIKKGEIPFNEHLTCEAKNFKMFFLHTVSDWKMLLSRIYLAAIVPIKNQQNLNESTIPAQPHILPWRYRRWSSDVVWGDRQRKTEIH